MPIARWRLFRQLPNPDRAKERLKAFYERRQRHPQSRRVFWVKFPNRQPSSTPKLSEVNVVRRNMRLPSVAEIRDGIGEPK